jgi:hypothetical protein
LLLLCSHCNLQLLHNSLQCMNTTSTLLLLLHCLLQQLQCIGSKRAQLSQLLSC